MLVLNGLATCFGLALHILSALTMVTDISGIYVVAYNFAYAITDLVVMVFAGLQLKFYMKAVFPGVTTNKITKTLTYAAFCYAGRSLITLGLSILMQTQPNVKTDYNGVIWAIELMVFYVLTDLVFLGLILRIINHQNNDAESLNQFRNYSELSSRMIEESSSKSSSYVTV